MAASYNGVKASPMQLMNHITPLLPPSLWSARGNARQGGGHIGAFEEWWPSLRDDGEFAPDLCFLAINERQEIVGIAQCWTSAFIKDLVVHPLARRRGIATALLRKVFWEFRRRGVKHVDLKVQVDNPTGAVRLYKELGMREVALDGS